MTVVATWYREKFGEVWCVSDTRISSGSTTATDSGPKMLPIPVATFRQVAGANWFPHEQFTIGFAFAGSTLAALSAHALVSACTQNLARNRENVKSPSVRGIAEMVRRVGEHYVRDISSRMVGTQSDPTVYAFQAHVFGHCRAEHRYVGFLIYPEFSPAAFSMKCHELRLEAGHVWPMGTGAEKLIEIMTELDRASLPSGVIIALREMLKRDATPGVGGYFQCGIARPDGFRLYPILNFGGALDRHVTFLGFSTSSLGEFEGHHIGFQMFSPDMD